MRKLSRILAVLLAAIMVLGAFAACDDKNKPGDPTPNPTGAVDNTPTTNPEATPGEGDPTTPPDATEPPDIPLVVAYSAFSEKFSPFYADTAYDQDVAGMVGLSLMVTDRMGAIIYNAIDGETIPYNGTDYKYTGPANLSVEYDKASDTTLYRAQIRQDLKFWDGTPLTAKDILFTYYTYLDPSYVGSNSLSSYPIVGLQNWRTQTSDEVYEKYSNMAKKIFADGREYAASDNYSEELFNAYWSTLDKAWENGCQSIVDYVANNYGADSYVQKYFNPDLTWEQVAENEGLKMAFGMALWGFGDYNDDGKFESGYTTGSGDAAVWNVVKTFDMQTEFPTVKDYYDATFARYEGDPEAFFVAEIKDSIGGNGIIADADAAYISTYGPQDPEMGGKGITEIKGIKMVDDYTVEITVEGYSAPAVYQILGTTVTPMHYYGDTSKWNPAEGKYGFDFSDLSTQKEKTEVPRGAGPYVFESFKDKVVTFKANENWYKGKPIIKTIQFKETASNEVATALKTGAADAGEMTGSRTRFEEVSGINPEGEITGSIITTKKVDNLGYGYIGINADTVNVKGNPSSAESKALRKAIATVLAVYRDVAYDSYYGEAASVIQYPISNTSWAAPQASDPDYKLAFSVDPDGKEVYTASMTAEEKYDAALATSLAWFEAAGYTVADGKLTAAPDGAKLEYEIIIPGEGNGDHPSYAVLTMARDAFEKIGFKLDINDPADSNVLWDKLDSGMQEMWCAAWGSTIDPDMYQVYHGSNIVGKNGTDSNHYHIDDAQLNQLIMDARTSDDQAFRKNVYKQCLDIIVDWAVEIPAYQRQNCTVFSTQRINIDTLTPDITTFWNWMNDIEKLQMNYGG